MSSLLTSRRALTSVFACAAVVLAVLAGSLERQQEDRTFREVVAEAELISELLIEVELIESEGRSVLPPRAKGRIDARVGHLAARSRLVGLQLWHPDGELLYTDTGYAEPLTADERAHLRAVLGGRAQVEFEQDEGRIPTATVLTQPRGTDGEPSGLVAEVLLPQDQVVADLEAAARNLYLGGALLLAGTLALAVAARRRLLRREHEALHDPLTGLGNRALLVKEAQTASARRRSRGAGPRAALLLLDLDGFKQVNDTFGHEVGDMLLAGVAGALRGAVRRGDVATRLGGDEFAVLLRDVPSDSAAVQAARSIAEALRRPLEVHGRGLDVGVSIGVAVPAEQHEDLSSLLRRADVAMYQAKRRCQQVRLHDATVDSPDEVDLPTSAAR